MDRKRKRNENNNVNPTKRKIATKNINKIAASITQQNANIVNRFKKNATTNNTGKTVTLSPLENNEILEMNIANRTIEDSKLGMTSAAYENIPVKSSVQRPPTVTPDTKMKLFKSFLKFCNNNKNLGINSATLNQIIAKHTSSSVVKQTKKRRVPKYIQARKTRSLQMASTRANITVGGK